MPPPGVDVEAGPSNDDSVLDQPRPSGDDDEEDFDDPFDIAHTKHAPHHSLRRWRVRFSSLFL